MSFRGGGRPLFIFIPAVRFWIDGRGQTHERMTA